MHIHWNIQQLKLKSNHMHSNQPNWVNFYLYKSKIKRISKSNQFPFHNFPNKKFKFYNFSNKKKTPFINHINFLKYSIPNNNISSIFNVLKQDQLIPNRMASLACHWLLMTIPKAECWSNQSTARHIYFSFYLASD